MSQDNGNTLGFISEWKNKARRQQIVYGLAIVLALLVAFLICFVLFSLFRSSNYERIIQLNMDRVTESTVHIVDKMEQQLGDALKEIKGTAIHFATLLSIRETATYENLERVTDIGVFDRVGFLTPDGMSLSLMGNDTVIDRPYFQRGLKGETGYDTISLSRITGSNALVFYTPVYLDSKIVGVMAGFYDKDKLQTLFNNKVYHSTPITYLLSSEGTVLASSTGDGVGDDMKEFLSTRKYRGDADYSDVLRAIDDSTRTDIAFTFDDNGSTVVGVIAQFHNGDWMVFSLLPYTVTEEMIMQANSVGIIIEVCMVGCFILTAVLSFCFITFQNRRYNIRMEEAESNLVEAIETDRKQSFVISSLGKAYNSIYLMDAATERYERIVEKDSNVSNIAEEGFWEKGYSYYVKAYVAPEYQESMLNYLQIPYIVERLSKRDYLSMEYKRLDEKWRRALLIPAEKDESGNIKAIVFAVEIIDEEKKKEEDTRRALEEAYEAAQMASAAKTTFLSSMSHDIRTPMNAIVGMTAIAEANLDNKQKVADCLTKITSSSKHLLSLINEVLDMSKIESGKVDLMEEDFVLPDMIDELLTINQSLIKKKKHTLLVRVQSLRHERVSGDRTRLQQVFTNLLSNAIKYTPEGGKIEITLSEKETNKDSIGCFEVVFKDNGMGMSKEFQKKIFEPFSRAKDKRLGNIQGTGLGMSIARNIIRMMGGDITVESELDKGSAFTVTFVLRLQKEATIDLSHLENLHVLVADDDEDACLSTCQLLHNLKMQGEYVTSGRDAVEKIKEKEESGNGYYAVILDWKMPGMDGVETARTIRAEIGPHMPIVVLSAYDWSDIKEEAEKAGVNAFLSKPLFRSRLVDLFSSLDKGNVQSEKSEGAVGAGVLREHDFSGSRILLTEDNMMNRIIATELLSMTGVSVEEAEDGETALEKFQASAPGYYNLIFMDIQMPGMNGYETARAIRACGHQDAAKVPIIAMTANAFSTDVAKAFEAGMNGHIAKPIDIKAINKVLEEHLS